jgi:undecaprenyl-diphosphatase
MRPIRPTALLSLSIAGLIGYYIVARSVSRRTVAADDRQVRDEIQKSRDVEGDKVAAAIGPIGKQWLHIPASALLSAYLMRQGMGVRGSLPLAASVTSDMVSRLFDRLPPNRKPPPGHPNQKKPSFPSGHANETTAVALTSAYLLSRAGYVAPVPAFSVAVVLSTASPTSRMYLDRHWLSDVIGGWLLGLATATACAALYESAGDRDSTHQLVGDRIGAYQ